MRRVIFVLALIVSTGLTAYSQDEPEGGGLRFEPDEEGPPAPKLDVKFFKGVAPGDWALYRRTTSTRKGPRVETFVLSVASVDSAKGIGFETVSRALGIDFDNPSTSTHSGGVEAARLGDARQLLYALGFHHDIESVKIADVKVAPEKKVVAGRAFACTRISGTWQLLRGKTARKLTIWLSKDVKGAGVVAIEGETVTFELLGYGTKGKTLWGKTEQGAQDAVTAEEYRKWRGGR